MRGVGTKLGTSASDLDESIARKFASSELGLDLDLKRVRIGGGYLAD